MSSFGFIRPVFPSSRLEGSIRLKIQYICSEKNIGVSEIIKSSRKNCKGEFGRIGSSATPQPGTAKHMNPRHINAPVFFRATV